MPRGHSPAGHGSLCPDPGQFRPAHAFATEQADDLETATWRGALGPGWGACRRGAEQGLPEETYQGRAGRVTREVAEKELEAEDTDWGNACERCWGGRGSLGNGVQSPHPRKEREEEEDRVARASDHF